MKTIKLNDDQYKLLLNSLENYDDCGSSLGSYKSNELKEIVAVISAANFDEGDIVPQGQISNFEGDDEVILPLSPKVAEIAAKVIREAIEKCKTPQPKSPWIPVSERLPEGSHTYIVSDRKNVSTAFYNKQTGNFVFPDGSYATVTHWMPLPPLPE